MIISKLKSDQSGDIDKLLQFILEEVEKLDSPHFLLINTSQDYKDFGYFMEALTQGNIFGRFQDYCEGFLQFQNIWKKSSKTKLELNQGSLEQYLKTLNTNWSNTNVVENYSKVIDNLIEDEATLLDDGVKFYSEEFNNLLGAIVEENDDSVFNIHRSDLKLLKKLSIEKDKMSGASVILCPSINCLSGHRCYVESLHPEIEIQNKVVSIKTGDRATLSIKNISSKRIKFEAGDIFGIAKLCPDTENVESVSMQEGSESDSSTIDKYLLSSDEEEEDLPLKRIATRNRNSRGTRSSSRSDSLMKKTVVKFDTGAEMISTLEEYKRTLQQQDKEDSCSKRRTPEKTSHAKKLIEEEEYLDILEEDVISLKNDDISSVVDDKAPLKIKHEETNESEGEKRFKKRLDFKEEKVSTDEALLPQLKSLSMLLKPVALKEDLNNYFPGLFGQEQFAGPCESLAKFAMFSEGNLSFDVCDLGDKVVCELSSMLIDSSLPEMKQYVEKINQDNPAANLETWKENFSEKFDSFQGINDLLGEDFDAIVIQLLLLHFVKEMKLKPSSNQVTGLIGVLENVVKVEEEQREDQNAKLDMVEKQTLCEVDLENKIANIALDMEKVFLGIKTGSDNEVLIIVNGQAKTFQLENIYKAALLDKLEDDGIYVILVTEPLSPKCELAISLSSWNQMAEEIFSDGFILYSLSSSKFEVAVFDDEKIFTTSLTRRQIKVADEDGASSCLRPGAQLKIILNKSSDILLGVVPLDGKMFEVMDASKWKFDLQQIKRSSNAIASCQLLRHADDRKFLLFSGKSKQHLYQAQRNFIQMAELKDSQQKDMIYSQWLAHSLQASKKEIYNLRNIFTTTNTTAKLLNGFVKIEGADEKSVQTAACLVEYSLKKLSHNFKQEPFVEFSLGHQITVQEKQKRKINYKIKSSLDIEEFSIILHFDLSKNYPSLRKSKIMSVSDKCVEIEFRNSSDKTITILADQSILLLVKRDKPKSKAC